jgi:hypothetical protein
MFPGNGYNYTHLTGAGTTTILEAVGASQAGAPAAGPGNTGVLGGIEINTAGTSVTVYDSATGSGTVVAVYGAVTGCFNIPKILKNGLTVVIVGAADVTVMWA